MKKQQGSLIIEIIISMLIGIFLMYGALEILLATRKNDVARAALSIVDKGGRLAVEMLSHDIRSASDRGCLSNHKTLSLGILLNGYYAAANLDINIGLRGWEYTGTGVNDTLSEARWTNVESFNSNQWRSGGVDDGEKGVVGKNLSGPVDFMVASESDVIRLWSVEPYTLNAISATANEITVNPGSMNGFPIGNNTRLLIVSDCERSVLVKGTQFSAAGTITLEGTTSSTALQLEEMHSSAQVAILRGVQYSLEKPVGRDRPSLYRRVLKSDGTFGERTEVLPGVLNMQFLYGEHLNGDDARTVNAYLTADQVKDWKNVISVRIWMLVENERDHVISDSLKTRYYDRDYTVNDHRARRGFFSTITIRNRVLGM